MQTSILHDGGSSFDDRTAILQVALGAISTLKRFRLLLEEHAPPLAAGEAARPLPRTREECAALDLALGIVCVSQHLMDYLALARTRRATPFAAVAKEEPQRVSSLKPRDLLEYPS